MAALAWGGHGSGDESGGHGDEVPGKRADHEVLTMSEELAERGEVLIGTTTYEPSVQEAEAMLQAVRKRADGWRNGVGATLTLVMASLAVKPGESGRCCSSAVRSSRPG